MYNSVMFSKLEHFSILKIRIQTDSRYVADMYTRHFTIP